MDVLQLLLKRNPDLTIKNAQGKTAIDIADSKNTLNAFCSYLNEEKNITPKQTLLTINNKNIKVYTKRKEINTEDLYLVVC